MALAVIRAILGGERNSRDVESSSTIGKRSQQNIRVIRKSGMEFESCWTKHQKLSAFTAQAIHFATAFMHWSSRISLSEGYHEFL